MEDILVRLKRERRIAVAFFLLAIAAIFVVQSVFAPKVTGEGAERRVADSGETAP